jgi:hypothetical protein
LSKADTGTDVAANSRDRNSWVNNVLPNSDKDLFTPSVCIECHVECVT